MLLQQCPELTRVDRLVQHPVTAGLLEFIHFRFIPGGKGNDRAPETGLTQHPGRLRTIHLRHVAVHQHQVHGLTHGG